MYFLCLKCTISSFSSLFWKKTALKGKVGGSRPEKTAHGSAGYKSNCICKFCATPRHPPTPTQLQKTLPYATPRLPKMTIKVSEVTKLVTRLMGHLFQRPSQGQTHEAQSWKNPQRVVLPSDFQSGPQDFRGTSTGPHLPGSTQLVVYIKLPYKLASEGVLVA